MRQSGRGRRPVGIALLVLYGALLPLLVLQTTSAHRYEDPPGTWRYSVRNNRLDYIMRSDFTDEVQEARYQWRQAGPVAVGVTDNPDVAEITVSDANSCDLAWIGKYDYGTDKIRFNKCAMNFNGGFYRGAGENFGPTPQSRRNRTVVHEFGHAQGLGHNGLSDCASILSEIDQDQPTCWIPKTHDVDDINQYW